MTKQATIPVAQVVARNIRAELHVRWNDGQHTKEFDQTPESPAPTKCPVCGGPVRVGSRRKGQRECTARTMPRLNPMFTPGSPATLRFGGGRKSWVGECMFPTLSVLLKLLGETNETARVVADRVAELGLNPSFPVEMRAGTWAERQR